MPISPVSLLQFSRRGRPRRPSRWLALAIVAAPTLSLTGCYPSPRAEAAVLVDCDTVPETPHVGLVKVSCHLTEPDGTNIRASGVRLEANMTHPGMQPVRASMTESAEGHFEARIELTMAGDWYLVVSGESDTGARFEGSAELPGVRSE